MTPPTLRPYQVDVIERMRARLREGKRRGIIQAATGAGKTHISSEIIRCAVAKGKRCLFLAHRRRLIKQKAERLDAFGVPYGVLMAGEPTWRGAPVQVASRDTLLSRSVRNDWAAPPPADLVIVDECHNCLSDEYQRLLALYRDAIVIGLTATPARSDGRGLGDYYEALECAVPTSQLVREGWLAPVRCYAPARQGGGRKAGLAGDPVEHWKRYAEGRPTVFFAGKVEHSLAAVQAFCSAGVPAEHIDADTPDAEREAVLARVRGGETRVVANVGIMTEGVDVPELSCCVLFRVTGSYVLYAQAVGRIMRAHPGKRDAVLLDHAGACLRHGLPDVDVEWSLDGKDSVDARKKKARKEGREEAPACCPVCGRLFAGSPQCPACGWQVRRKKAAPQAKRDDLLEEVTRSASPAELRAEKARYWQTCLAVMAHKGRTAGAAGHMYRGRFGRWPDDSLPNVPRGVQWRQPVANLYPQFVRRGAA